MYENAFNSIERHLRAEEGIANELDYVEQTSWVLFLKYLHDLENERRDRAELNRERYAPLIDPDFCWDDWAAPRTAEGEFDHNEALVGDDLIAFIDKGLFPYLASFRQDAQGPRTIEYKIGEIFTELRNKFRLRLHPARRAGDRGRALLQHAGPAPRALAAIRDSHSPHGQCRAERRRVLHPAPFDPRHDQGGRSEDRRDRLRWRRGIGRFPSANPGIWHMRRPDLAPSDYETLQRGTFFGQEKKSLAYIIGIMNMVLHGIEAPNIVHTNSLNENVMDYQERDRHDIVLANPPFGGGERREVQHNFPIRSGETAYLFLQHFIRKLRAGGRAAVVIKNTFLSNTDNASVALRRELLESCTLHTILDCPQGTFHGAGVKTVVLFFEKGAPTRHIWYYQLDPGRSLGKTDPLNDDDLAEFVALQQTFAEGPQSWRVACADLDDETLELSVKNPNATEDAPLRSPEAIIDDMLARDVETVKILEDIRSIL